MRYQKDDGSWSLYPGGPGNISLSVKCYFSAKLLGIRPAAPASTPRFGRIDADLADVESAVVRSREYVLSQQHPEGFWCGELEADSMLEADYIFLHTLLESGDPARLHRAYL